MRESWVESANDSQTDFPIENLPYVTFRAGTECLPHLGGIGSTGGAGDSPAHLGVGIGNQILDLSKAFGIPSMKTVMSLPRSERTDLRRRIQQLLTHRTPGAD